MQRILPLCNAQLPHNPAKWNVLECCWRVALHCAMTKRLMDAFTHVTELNLGPETRSLGLTSDPELGRCENTSQAAHTGIVKMPAWAVLQRQKWLTVEDEFGKSGCMCCGLMRKWFGFDYLYHFSSQSLKVSICSFICVYFICSIYQYKPFSLTSYLFTFIPLSVTDNFNLSGHLILSHSHSPRLSSPFFAILCHTKDGKCTVYVTTILRGHIVKKRNDDHQIVIVFTATHSQGKANT